MSGRWAARGRRTAARALLTLAAFCCLGAVAFAATRPQGVQGVKGLSRPLQPHMTEYPASATTSTTARFAFVQPPRPPARARPGRPLHFDCRLDRGEWERCRPPLELAALRRGRHRFEVRAVNADGRAGPAARRAWKVARRDGRPNPGAGTPTPADPVQEEPASPEGQPFSIEPQLSGLGDLFPGAPAQPLPVTLGNPSSEPIFVTALSVAISPDPAGCDSASNFELIPASLSAAAPLEIPPGAQVTLPIQGISPPAIAMRDLPVSQDACQRAELPLLFSGEAHG